ncbi:MAG TPA: ATP-binding cassette domain-containing protein [Ktedonobacterales bacterium]|nr:ATP-binding cassette domain-containing protein [Ktedonobacterales bacterium]
MPPTRGPGLSDISSTNEQSGNRSDAPPNSAGQYDAPPQVETPQVETPQVETSNNAAPASRTHSVTATASVALQPGEALTFGSGAESDVILDDPQVAARQARLARSADGDYMLENLDQAHPIFVNGLEVRETRLAPGAEVGLGQRSYTFTGSRFIPYDDLSSIQIDALHLRETVGSGLFGRRQKILLDDISLSVPPGAFVAIVGSSGAGKTTLLNALNGLRPPQEGAVLYNGRDLYQELAVFSQAQGYVPQDDIIHKHLTVERALAYAARLRLPGRPSHRQITERIEETLEDIDMTAQRHQVIARLSGGQRKRISIGVELLARPGVFFLDEPTSGLDPALDRHIMQLLRRLADRGQTIVLTTHTMSHIDLCDFVCFLAPGGRLAYFGAPEQMQRHFQMADYADIYAAIHADPDRWVAFFRQSPDYLRYVDGPRLQSENKSRPRSENTSAPAQAPTHRVGMLRQLALLTARYLEIFLRDRMNLLILLAQAPVIALLVALLTHQNVIHHLTSDPGLRPSQDIYAQRSLFIMVCSAAWFGIINAAREIVKERPIYRRERAIYLAILPYALSKAIVLGALALAQSVILLLIVGARAGFPTHGLLLAGQRGAFIEMWATLWLVTLAGIALGLMISALAPNADRAVSLVPLLLVPQIIFANVIFSLSGSSSVISWFAPSRWGMQALGSIAQLRDRFSGQQHAFYTSSASHLLGYWLALGALVALYFGLTLLALRRSDGPQKR